MKKLISCFIITFLIVQCTVFAESNKYVFMTKSHLASYVDLDFDSVYLTSPVKEVRLGSGKGNYGIIKENDETFLRFENYSDEKDCYFYIDLPKSASGEIAIEFDARISKLKYMQMPTVVGISDDKKSNVDLTRILLGSNGTISLDAINVAKYSSLPGDKKWTKFTIYLNTVNDAVRLFVDDVSSPETQPLSKMDKITSLRFLVRGQGQKLDIDNLKIFDCKLNEEILSGVSDDTSSGLPLPVRHKKEAYKLIKSKGEIVLDGNVSEWDNSLYVHLKKSLMEKTGTDVYAAAKFDDSGIYVAMKARDKVLLSGQKDTPWLQDSFEVYIDAKDENTAFYQENDIQLVMPYNEDGIYCAKETGGAIYKYSNTDYGWCAEVFIPYSLISTKLLTGDIIGLDFGYNDSNKEGERQGQFMWFGSSRNSTSTTAFGTAILSEN